MRAPTNRTDLSVRRLHMDRDHATAIIGQVGVVVWRGETTLAAVAKVREMGVTALQSVRGPVCIIGVVEETTKVPQSEGRIASAKVNDELAEMGVVGFAGVIPREGFSGAWIRGVITALHLLARKRYPFRVFESSVEASNWIVKLIGGSPASRKSLAVAIDEFRQDYYRAWSAGTQTGTSGAAVRVG